MVEPFCSFLALYQSQSSALGFLVVVVLFCPRPMTSLPSNQWAPSLCSSLPHSSIPASSREGLSHTPGAQVFPSGIRALQLLLGAEYGCDPACQGAETLRCLLWGPQGQRASCFKSGLQYGLESSQTSSRLGTLITASRAFLGVFTRLLRSSTRAEQ